MVLIRERKNRKLTGRKFYLCPHCRVDYFKMEIKELNPIYQEILRKWNKEYIQ